MNLSYGVSDISPESMFLDIEKAISFLEDKNINWNKMPKGNNIGVCVDSSSVVNEGFFEASLSDVLANDDNFCFKYFYYYPECQKYSVNTVRKANKTDFKGEIKFLHPKTIYLSSMVYEKDKKGYSDKTPFIEDINFEKKTGLKYRCILNGLPDPTEDKLLYETYRANNFLIALGLSLAWEDFFKWKIRVKMPEWQRSVDFYINPSNIKEVFKMRDIVDGEQRRKALKTIVHSHCRKLSSGEITEVMRHLRGKEEFTMNGYELSVIPSKDDLLRCSKIM